MEQAQNYICRFTATSKNANYQKFHIWDILQYDINLSNLSHVATYVYLYVGFFLY